MRDYKPKEFKPFEEKLWMMVLLHIVLGALFVWGLLT